MVSRTGRSATEISALTLTITLTLTFILLTGSACSRTKAAEEGYRRAWSAFAGGRLAQAAEEASRQAAGWRNEPDSAWLHRFRLLQAEALIAQGKTKEADAILATPVPESRELRELEARRLIDQAQIRVNQKAEATELLRRASAAVQDPELQVRIRSVEGTIALTQRENAAAEVSYRAAADLAAKHGLTYWQAQTLNNYSVAVRRQSRYEEAVEILLRALDLAEKTGARRVAAQAHGNLGSVYSFLGETGPALEHEEKSVKAQEEIGDRVNLSVALGELGLLHDRAAEPEKAIPNYERAHKLAVELGRERDAARHAENLALALLKLARWDEAARWNQQAAETAARLKLADMVPYLERNKARIAFGRGQLKEAIRICEDLLRSPNVPADVRWSAHSSLGEIAAEAKQFARARREYETALRIIDGTRSDLVSSQYRITLLSRLISFYQGYVDLLVRQGDDGTALRIVESSRARVLAERLGRQVETARFPDPAGLRRFAANNRVAMLSFWFAARRSFAWLITAGAVKRFDLPVAAEAARLVNGYRELVEHSVADPVTGGDEGAALWNGLLAKIAEEIPKGTRVIVVPDGPVHRLNLETLVAPAPQPHYWVQDVEIAVAPSIAIAVTGLPRAAARQPALLLIGAPDYTGSRYEPLKGAEGELKEIARHFPQVQPAVYTGRQASPEAYRQAGPARFSVIHFAAHAEANDEKPLESAVVLARVANSQKLYAREVIDLPIGADLVTLSACRSAGVRAYAGEGLIGFAWAFLQAGARAVAAGLWEVSDSSSAPLMGRFYAGVGGGRDPIAAMREAKLALMKEARFRKPFYWGPFQVYVRSAIR